LKWIRKDIVVFFDDDVVVDENCLAELEKVHRQYGEQVVGVGATITNEIQSAPLLWRVRRLLGIVGDLRPGSYQYSGLSVPWGFLPASDEVVFGDWLAGGATSWRTEAACRVRFDEDLTGYAQSEDLDFSLRARAEGRVAVSGTARVLHLHEPGGRPAGFARGRMEIVNRYRIHRRSIPNRNWRHAMWFFYAWIMETLLLARNWRSVETFWSTTKQMFGRFQGSIEVVLMSAKSAT
jgi:GT2 family glycosyltransferase